MNHPSEQPYLHEAIRRILAIVHVHRIYRSPQSPNLLTVVLKGRRQAIPVLEPIIGTQLEKTEYEVALLHGRDVKAGLLHGSIMLSNTFHPDRLLYIDPESDDAVFEQLLRGFIHRSLDYTPKDRSLPTLLELLSHTAPALVDECSLMRQELQRLSALFRHTRYGRVALYDEPEVAKLQRKLTHALEVFRGDYF